MREFVSGLLGREREREREREFVRDSFGSEREFISNGLS
jgi:hypothetical protein